MEPLILKNELLSLILKGYSGVSLNHGLTHCETVLDSLSRETSSTVSSSIIPTHYNWRKHIYFQLSTVYNESWETVFSWFFWSNNVVF